MIPSLKIFVKLPVQLYAGLIIILAFICMCDFNYKSTSLYQTNLRAIDLKLKTDSHNLAHHRSKAKKPIATIKQEPNYSYRFMFFYPIRSRLNSCQKLSLNTSASATHDSFNFLNICHRSITRSCHSKSTVSCTVVNSLLSVACCHKTIDKT